MHVLQQTKARRLAGRAECHERAGQVPEVGCTTTAKQSDYGRGRYAPNDAELLQTA